MSVSTLNSYCVLRTLIFLIMDNCSVCVLSVMLAQNIAFPLPILAFWVGARGSYVFVSVGGSSSMSITWQQVVKSY